MRTYAGKVGYYPVNKVSGHVIKTEDDLPGRGALAAGSWGLTSVSGYPATQCRNTPLESDRLHPGAERVTRK